MYFWVILASLMGIISFGVLREKTKDANDFVVPIYEALSQNLLVQHNATLSALRARYLAAGSWDFAGNGQMTKAVAVAGNGGVAYHVVSQADVAAYLPYGFKFTPGYTSAYFCVYKVNQSQPVSCSDENAVMYLVTYADVPVRYAGANARSIPKAIADGTQNSRFVGLIEKASAPLTDPMASGKVAYGQPLGATHYILSAGYAPASSTYIPNFFICALQTENAAQNPVGKMIAQTMVKGLENGENMIEAGNPCWWP